MNQIEYIKQDQIDRQKWDRCIEDATNGLIYGYSWYLDSCNVKWDALILNDYEAVMPLTWNRKYGITYLFQPWYCACLGIFSINKLTDSTVDAFLHAIPDKFQYTDICLNFENRYSGKVFSSSERVSYTLSLRSTYEELRKNYRTQLKRNLSKAIRAGLTAKWEINTEEILPLAKEVMQRISPITDKEMDCLIPLTKQVRQQKKAESIGIYSQNNELLASAIFYYSHKRWYYLIVGNHPNGKTLGASHFLIDRFIERHAASESILDFEGSDVRNIAYFYSSFGASPEIYQSIKQNRLPKIIRWLKK